MIVAGILFIVGALIGGAIGFLCGYKFAIGELKQKEKKTTLTKMKPKSKEQERREQCPYYWEKKGVKYGVCSASPHAEYSDEPCWLNNCFWMKEWIYEHGDSDNDR